MPKKVGDATGINVDQAPGLIDTSDLKPEVLLSDGSSVSSSVVREFTDLLIRGHRQKAFDCFDDLVNRGVSAEALFLDLLSPSAQMLGEGWRDDDCSYADVTVGMTALHRLLNKHRALLRADFDCPPTGHTILLSSMTDDTHIFGTAMLEAFFEASGWSVHMCLNEGSGALVEEVSTVSYDILGLSVGQSGDLGNCRQLIELIRANSINRNTRIMVGGWLFTANPSLVDFVGADGSAANATEALAVANALYLPRLVLEDA